ncbi:MAG: hypothetical protein IJA52_01300 [Clostridia bacterium]|nr:hypothetical protein [Clostridia bacterium]
MICKIADLLIDVPASGGLAPRCREYLTDEKGSADIIIRAELYRARKYPQRDESFVAYMESAYQFYRQLVKYEGFYLHSSAVEYGGRAYLFSASSGTGKSTHTRLWQSLFGEEARVFNDDKPALRYLDGRWLAYGTPWCGKDGININMKAPVAGICFLRRGGENSIRRLTALEATARILSQTMHRFYDAEYIDLLASHIDKLVREIPVYELCCLPDEDAARLSYETMRRGAMEAGL